MNKAISTPTSILSLLLSVAACDHAKPNEQSVAPVAEEAAAPKKVATPADGQTPSASMVKAAAQAERARGPGPLPPGHSQQLPPGHPPIGGGAGKQVDAKPAGLQGPKGAVQEVVQAGRYTYLKIADQWAAVTAANVSVGDQVSIVGAMKMKNFTSKTTKRVFKEVWFGHMAKPAVAKPTTKAAPAKTVRARVALDAANKSISIADLYRRRQALKGASVTLRGKVVKANDGILGRAWIHLQDGTGAEGEHDVTVTMPSLAAKLGDVVTVRGTLVLDRDFGAGYRYPVIVEGASVIAR